VDKNLRRRAVPEYASGNGNILIGLLTCAPFTVLVLMVIIQLLVFDINVTGHLKWAAKANNIKLAVQQMDIAVSYLEEHNLTSGYTLFRWPTHDIGFWYTNLLDALNDLEDLDPEAGSLEVSNVLMKLRETILEEGEGSRVTTPFLAFLHPYVGHYSVLAIILFTPAIFGAGRISMGIHCEGPSRETILFVLVAIIVVLLFVSS